MIKRFLILIVLLFLSVVGIADDQELTGRATMVHDGDTFILLCDDPPVAPWDYRHSKK